MGASWAGWLAKYRYFVVLAIIVFAGIIVALFTTPPKANQSKCTADPFAGFAGQRQELAVGGRTYSVAIARTPEEQSKGLGGITCLSDSDAMLFIYDEPAISSFWMKDMVMPIDIVWLDANGSVITVAENITPDTYPKSFSPSAPAKYVLEARAGSAAANQWKTGTALLNPRAMPKSAGQQ